MNYEEAKKLHKKQYYEGKNKNRPEADYVFPYNYKHKEDEFIEVVVSIGELKFLNVDEEIVNKYKKILKKKFMGCVWLSFGKKLDDGTVNPHYHGRFELKDGNHRATASKNLHKEKIKGIIPESHYVVYLENKNGKNN